MTSGARKQLARYQLPDGTERALVAQRMDGRVAVSDVPVAGTVGTVHLVERHVTSLDELDELVAAYTAHSAEAGQPAIVAQRQMLDRLSEPA